MAYSIVQAATALSSGAGTTVSSSSFTPGADSKLLALVTISHTATTSGITCTLADTSGGNDTWSLLGSANDTGSLNIDIGYRWYLLEGAAATSTVVQATLSGSVNYARGIVVFEITGLDTTPYLDQAFSAQPNPGTGTDAVLSGTTGTLASQPALALAVATNTNGSSIPAAGTGWTSAWSDSGLMQRAEHQRLTSTSAIGAVFTCTADGSLDDHYSTIIVLKESAGGASAPKRALLMGVG